jgi:tetratricopeptide (TPR) repeat protein
LLALCLGLALACGGGAAPARIVTDPSAALPLNATQKDSGRDAQATAGPVRLLVAADTVLRTDREWLRGLSLVVQEAENLLYPYLGRPLDVVRTVPWQGSVRQASADSLLEDLMASINRGDAEIVVGLARAYSFQGFTEAGESVGGLANYRGAYAVLMLSGQLGAQHAPIAGIGALLAHELAHIFGAVHRSGGDLLLAPGGTGVRVDALNAALMNMHKRRSFGTGDFPLPVPYHEPARSLYRRAIDDNPNDLNARLMLARLDVETGRLDEAIAALEDILAESPGSLEARADLQLALSRQGRRNPLSPQPSRVTPSFMRESLPLPLFDFGKARICS